MFEYVPAALNIDETSQDYSDLNLVVISHPLTRAAYTCDITFLLTREQCSASKATTMSSKNATQRETGCSETEACTLIPLKKEVLDNKKNMRILIQLF